MAILRLYRGHNLHSVSQTALPQNGQFSVVHPGHPIPPGSPGPRAAKVRYWNSGILPIKTRSQRPSTESPTNPSWRKGDNLTTFGEFGKFHAFLIDRLIINLILYTMGKTWCLYVCKVCGPIVAIFPLLASWCSLTGLFFGV